MSRQQELSQKEEPIQFYFLYTFSPISRSTLKSELSGSHISEPLKVELVQSDP